MTHAEIVAGGTSLVRDFVLLNTNREMKIRSINWDYIVQNTVTGKVIPTNNITDTRIVLIIGDANKKLCEAVTPTAPFKPLYNGGVFYVIRPQQIILNSLYLRTDLDCRVVIDNFITAGAEQISFIGSLVIETEEKIIYT